MHSLPDTQNRKKSVERPMRPLIISPPPMLTAFVIRNSKLKTQN